MVWADVTIKRVVATTIVATLFIIAIVPAALVWIGKGSMGVMFVFTELAARLEAWADQYNRMRLSLLDQWKDGFNE